MPESMKPMEPPKRPAQVEWAPKGMIRTTAWNRKTLKTAFRKPA